VFVITEHVDIVTAVKAVIIYDINVHAPS